MGKSEKQRSADLWLDFLWLEITGKCNLTCTHCYAGSSPCFETQRDLSFHDWMHVLDEASEVGCRKVQFIGGEPTLHPQLDELIAHADRCGFQFVEVYTNATRLSPELIGCFSQHRVNVATSFYSDVPAIHESITRGKGSWRHTVAGIQNVLNAGLPLRVGIIEMEQNGGSLESTFSFLQSLGVRNVGTDRKRRVGRGRSANLGKPVEEFDELCGHCWKGKLCVDSIGEVFPCVFSRGTQLGNINQGLAEILSSDKLREFREAGRERENRRINAVKGNNPFQGHPPGLMKRDQVARHS